MLSPLGTGAIRAGAVNNLSISHVCLSVRHVGEDAVAKCLDDAIVMNVAEAGRVIVMI